MYSGRHDRAARAMNLDSTGSGQRSAKFASFSQPISLAPLSFERHVSPDCICMVGCVSQVLVAVLFNLFPLNLAEPGSHLPPLLQT